MSLSKSPRGYLKIIKGLPEGLKEIKKRRLYELVREFYNNRLVSYKENEEGLTEIILTKDGEKIALKFRLDDIKIKKPIRPFIRFIRANSVSNEEQLMISFGLLN